MRMEFENWTARTKTPEVCKMALLHLQAHASAPVRDYFSIAPDGSFDLDAVTIEVTPGLV
jgi:hypothetical protein